MIYSALVVGTISGERHDITYGRTRHTVYYEKRIFDAVKTIADRCDGAHTQDGVGFNGSDTNLW